MPVPQHVLNWLYSVLTSEYTDVNRTYNDVARILTEYHSLSPRTDVHTFPDGASALLLHISGTLPVAFRGVTYRFPISLWVPHKYPREPPLVYVTPTGNLAVRPGQHVDPQGQVYHPYLNHWPSFWDKSTLLDFLAILTDVFAKEPPVVSRQQQPAPPPTSSPTPPPLPPHPSTASSPAIQEHQQHDDTPPPLPPLPPGMTVSHNLELRPTFTSPLHPPVGMSSHGPEARPPVLPPKETNLLQSTPHNQSPVSLPPAFSGTASQGPSIPSRYDSAPPLPPPVPSRPIQPAGPSLPYGQSHQQAQQGPSNRHAVSPPGPGLSPVVIHNSSHLDDFRTTVSPHPPPGVSITPGWQPSPFIQPPQPVAIQPLHDLLDEPLPSSEPPSTTTAPPVPPNPEKDALIQKLSKALFSQRQSSRQQNESSLAGLWAQRSAMQSATATLHSEISVLNQVSALLTSNTNILHEALRKADAVIEGSRSHPDTNIDELLVAPTVVANQLYNLVAEERAIGDAIFVVGRAMEKGRVSTAVFAKTTRSLAREWYLKKALIRKIEHGMALA